MFFSFGFCREILRFVCYLGVVWLGFVVFPLRFSRSFLGLVFGGNIYIFFYMCVYNLLNPKKGFRWEIVFCFYCLVVAPKFWEQWKVT